MIFKIPKDIKFSNFYKKMNILSIILIIFSLLMLSIKGLNFGVDFKGGTLIEIRSENPNIDITNIRQSLIKMNLGDVNVKKFGKEKDYLVKIEASKTNDPSFETLIFFLSISILEPGSVFPTIKWPCINFPLFWWAKHA